MKLKKIEDRYKFKINLKNKYDKKNDIELDKETKIFDIYGRIMALRFMGKAGFIKIKDFSGNMQCYVSTNTVGADEYKYIKKLDIGDIIYVNGSLFRTRTKELSVNVNCLKIINKSLHPLPNKWEGLKDKETKYRKRYLDLIMSLNTRNKFIIRSKVIKNFRTFLDNHDFLEVETPVFNQIAGGAVAKPFSTHHNSLNTKFFLRISPELYLKRLIVGGFEKIYELNKCFRNEGLSINHNPEFTMLEYYQTFSDYKKLMIFTEKMFLFVIKNTLGKTNLEYNNFCIDFKKPFKKMTMIESILFYNDDFKVDFFNSKDSLLKYLKQKNIIKKKDEKIGDLIYSIFEETVEKKLMEPTFITEYPVTVSPLAKRNSNNNEFTDRFELFICGKEISNGFSELNDPIDQEKRFKEQLKNQNQNQNTDYDNDYIEALEYGMPPTAGQGIGIDRFVMLLTNSLSIKDTLLFPCLKPN